MKTKLLKQLRKEAKKKYLIAKKEKGYCLYYLDEDSYDPFYRMLVFEGYYTDVEDIKRICSEFRRDYILQKVEERRKLSDNEKVSFLNFLDK